MGNKSQDGENRGKTLGQGLGNITDNDRGDLVGKGDRAPTKDQAMESGQSRKPSHAAGEHTGKRTLH